jgi:hypothetical protein
VSVAAGDPRNVSSFLLHGFTALPYYITAQFVVGERDDQVWPRMAMLGNTRAGLKLDVGDAHAVFHEEDVLSAAFEDVHTALLVPFGSRRLVGLLILQKLDGDITKRSVGESFDEVCEWAREETRLAVLQLEIGERLACDVVLELSGTEGYIDVIVIVAVHECLLMRRDFDFEDSDILVLEGEMMMGLGGDVDFGRLGVSDESDQQENGYESAFHATNSSIGKSGAGLLAALEHRDTEIRGEFPDAAY